MVQILPQNPNFGTSLLQALSQAGTDVAKSIQQKNASTALAKLLNQGNIQDVNPNASQIPTGDDNKGAGMTMPQQSPVSDVGINPTKLLQAHDLASKALGLKQADVLVSALTEQSKLSHKERIQERKEETEAYKSTADYRKSILDSYEASKRTNNQLDRMEQLNKEGKLTSPVVAKISESLGLPLSTLSNPQSEEFQKLSQDLMSNITKYYGNRILQVEVENFLKSIPTLLNSPEGKSRVINNMKILMEPSQIAYEEYKNIRKENKKLPLDLHEQVLERMEPRLEKLSDKFKSQTTTSNENQFSFVKDPQGNVRKIPNDRLAEALQAGGILEQ